jgi:hypothetical protein
MRHLTVAFAALLLLACAALQQFDTPPALPLVGQASDLAAAPAIRHSGALREITAAGLAEIAPPARFQGDASAVIVFGHEDVIASLCGARNANGVGPIACAGAKDGTPVIAAPNPCLAAAFDVYAAILCHELGHVNGWPKGHGD